MLHKVREFVNTWVLKSFYHAIFDCHLNYENIAWDQNKTSLSCLFSLYCYRRKPLESLVLNVEMLILIIFSIDMKQFNYNDKISKSFNFDLPSIFNNWFIFSSDSHMYKTSCSFKGFLKIKNINNKKYGREALINSAISS